MSKEKLDSFEKSVKDSYKNYELPYSPSGWSSLSRSLLRKRLLGSAAFWGSLFVIGGGVIAGGMYFYSEQPNAVASSETTQVVIEGEKINSDSQNSGGIISNDPEIPGQNNDLLSMHSENHDADINSENSSHVETSNLNENPGNSSNSNTNNVDQSLTIIPSIKTACAGSPVQFQAKNSAKNGSYLWNFGDGSFSNEENPTHTFKKAGTFDISLSITNPNDGQISTVAMRGLITILPKPNAEFAIEFEPSSSNQAQISLNNTTASFETFTWQFSNGQSSSEKSPSLLFGLSGKHQIKLDVSNEFGCTDVQNASVRMNDSNNYKSIYELKASKVNFLPKELIENNNFKLNIYLDKQPIFESTSSNKVWNGSIKGGSKAQPGQEFTYVLTTFNSTKMEYKYFQGKIQIVP